MDKGFIIGTLMMLPVLGGCSQGQEGMLQVDAPEMSYWFAEPADSWETETLPFGNGNIAASVFGTVAEERLTFNEKSLWRGGPNTSAGAGHYWDANKESAPLLEEIRHAFLDGDSEKAAELTRRNFNGHCSYNESEEDPFRFGNFTTGGEFRISTGIDNENITDYRRGLSLDSAKVCVSFLQNGTRYRREYFISHPDNVLVMRFSADRQNSHGRQDVQAGNDRQNGKDVQRSGGQRLELKYIPNPAAQGDILPDGTDGLVYIGRLRDNNMKYVVRIRAICPGAEAAACAGNHTVAEAAVAGDGNQAAGVDKLVAAQVAVDDARNNRCDGKSACRGIVDNLGGILTVTDTDEAVFIVTADTDYRINFDPDFTDPLAYVGEDPEKTTAEWMSAAAVKSYEQLYDAHYQDYISLYNRVRLRLGDAFKSQQTDASCNNLLACDVPTNCPVSSTSDTLSPDGTCTSQLACDAPGDLPINRRFENYRDGVPDLYLEELYYQFGRYLLISSSREGNLPANLQGMWHDGVDGPWHVDYHNNINLQMNYWPACMTNLSECMMPLVDFIRSQEKPGERVAQSYYGAKGWTTSISSNIFGFASPLSSGDMSWNLCPIAGPWLATHIWDYYDYTRDRDFLEKTGYELLRGSAEFVSDYLWRRPDGKYTAAPSTSPEHGPVDAGATFVHAVARELLSDAIEASELLDRDEDARAHWQEVLDNIVPYQTGRYGQLMEWSEDIDDPQDDHRHVNHLFGLHPGHSISPVRTPELAEAARVVLNHRGDAATGWSMGWKLNQWARLHDGNRAYTLYSNLLKYGTADNCWDMHPPFQIDGNFGGTAGVTEMLLQSHDGFINILPALPDCWASGAVSGLCARGAFELAFSWEDSQLKELTILSGAGEDCVLRYGDSSLEFPTRKGKVYRLCCEGGRLTIL